MKVYLFVYGLLRQKAQHDMSRYLAEKAKFISEATYQGRLYLIDYYPGVVPSDNPNDSVCGEVFEITEQAVLDELDFFEGIGEGFPTPTEYIRQLQKVTLEGGSVVSAYIYLFNWPLEASPYISSGDFLTSYRSDGER